MCLFFTGAHADYHRPSDTWDKIDADGLRTVTTVAYRVVRALADRDDLVDFVRRAGRSAARGAPGPPVTARTSAPYRTSATSQPASPLSAASVPGSPADWAGLQTGDVIVRFAG